MYRNILILPDGAELLSGAGTTNAIKSVKLTEMVNSGEDLIIGSCCCDMIEATIFTPGGVLDITAGDEVTLYKESSTGERLKMGVFTVEAPTRPTANTMKIVGYDHVAKLDKDLTVWLNSLSGWPYTVNAFAQLVCEACGLSFTASEIANADFPIKQWSKSGVTGRQIMRWLGEIACRFVHATPDGDVQFGWYTDSGKTFSPAGSNYYFAGSFSYENYQVAPVDIVQLRLADSESGAAWPAAEEGDNTYIITGNAILLSYVTDDLLPYLEAIQAELAGITYTPCEISGPMDPYVRAGSILTATDRNGKLITAYVMEKTSSGQRDTYRCTGSARRDSSSSLYGKTESKKIDEALASQSLRLTQDNVFNALTNNGEAQGFFLKDGQVYVNVTYLVTGVLKSKDGKTFYLDLDNGILKMQATEFSISGKTVDTIAQEKATAAENNAKSYASSAAGTAENNAKAHANTAAANAVAAQTQADIFNKLTNNGQDQGIYMVNGKLYINLQYLKAGSFTSSASVFLEPGQEEFQTIQNHILGVAAITNTALYDFDNSGSIGITDLTKCKQAMLGQASLASWSGAKKSTVTVTIDASNTQKAIRISGTNMWGRAVEYYLGFSGASLGTILGNLSVGGILNVGGALNVDGALTMNGKCFVGSEMLFDTLPDTCEENRLYLVKVAT